MHFLGLEGMPRRYSSYGEGSGWWFWNIVVSTGGILLGATFILFLYNIAKSLQYGKYAGADPWDGSTLEWAIASPPPHYNFATIPTTASRDPLWEAKYGSHGQQPLEQDIEIVEKVHAGVEDVEAPRHPHPHDVHVHMPNPSYYPLIASFGLFLIAIGLIFSKPRFNYQHLSVPIVCLLGGLVLVLGIYGWALEPASDPEIGEAADAEAMASNVPTH